MIWLNWKKKRFLYTLFSIFIFTSLILWENIVKWLEFINWHIILLISHLVVRIFFSNFSSCEYLNDIRLEEHSETLNQLFFIQTSSFHFLRLNWRIVFYGFWSVSAFFFQLNINFIMFEVISCFKMIHESINIWFSIFF